MTKDILSRLDEIENLPTLPSVARQLQQLTSSDRSSMAEIATVIARDQATSARVIRLINSAFYGMRNKVSSIQQAIVLMGLNTVKNLVTGVALVRAFADGGTASLFDRERFWVHTFACAMGARLIAQRLGKEEPEDYFLAGLLHDIGVLVLDQYFHEEFIEVVKHAVSRKIDYFGSEKAVLGTTHCEVGGVLALRWKIPDIFVLAIREHHTPSFPAEMAGRDADMVAVVHVANAAVAAKGIHMGIPNATRPCEALALRRLELRATDVDEVVEYVDKEVRNLMLEWGV